MKNIFSLQRVSLLFQKQWIESKKIYLASLAVLTGLLFAIYSFKLVSYNAGDDFGLLQFSTLPFRDTLLAFSALVYLSFISGNYFYRYHAPGTGIQELILPVSASEKLTVAFLGGVFMNVVGFTLIFFSMDALFVTVLKYLYKEVDFELLQSKYNYFYLQQGGFRYYWEKLDGKVITMFSVVSFLIPSIFLFGSIYFDKISYIKTAITTVVFFLLMVSIPSFLQRVLENGKISVVDYTEQRVFSEVIFITILVVSILCFWGATYHRLKEKEV